MVWTPLTVDQVPAAPVVETSSVPAAAVSVPTVADPLVRVGVNRTLCVEVLSMLTTNWANPPSARVGLVTLIVGVSLSSGNG